MSQKGSDQHPPDGSNSHRAAHDQFPLGAIGGLPRQGPLELMPDTELLEQVCNEDGNDLRH